MKVIDAAPLLVECIKHQLFRALIYISTLDGDFLTPLIKIFALYLDKKKQERLGQRCLWYIRMCFRRKMITG